MISSPMTEVFRRSLLKVSIDFVVLLNLLTVVSVLVGTEDYCNA